MSFLTYLECGLCGQAYEADRLWNLCPECGRPLLARYDLDQARAAVSPQAIAGREPTLWRYRELLPVRDPRYILCLGEGWTPLVPAARLGDAVGFENLFIKDEGLNPTGSFKARGLGVAVSRAFELGIKAVSIPSAGNAAGAMSAYAARAGMEAHVFMPRRARPCSWPSAAPWVPRSPSSTGSSPTAAGSPPRGCAEFGRFDLSTLKEPYRLEGKKTMGYELAEQMGWTLPDVIIYPTGGGTGLVGMWKAFAEMETLGWIGSERPRMVTVQSDGCAPMVRAFQEGREFAQPWEEAATLADGLRVPSAVGDFLILRALRESGGTALAVTDQEMIEAANLMGRTQGIFACPEGGATLAAFKHLRSEGWIDDNETVVLFNTGSGLKYAHLWA